LAGAFPLLFGTVFSVSGVPDFLFVIPDYGVEVFAEALAKTRSRSLKQIQSRNKPTYISMSDIVPA
jgi:hypothetical protein